MKGPSVDEKAQESRAKTNSKLQETIKELGTFDVYSVAASILLEVEMNKYHSIEEN